MCRAAAAHKRTATAEQLQQSLDKGQVARVTPARRASGWAVRYGDTDLKRQLRRPEVLISYAWPAIQAAPVHKNSWAQKVPRSSGLTVGARGSAQPGSGLLLNAGAEHAERGSSSAQATLDWAISQYQQLLVTAHAAGSTGSCLLEHACRSVCRPCSAAGRHQSVHRISPAGTGGPCCAAGRTTPALWA